MFFLQINRNCKLRQKKSFSIAYRNDIEAYQAFFKNPLMCMNKLFARRTVFTPPIKIKGSMSLEAAFALPFFLLLLLDLFQVIDMIRLQTAVSWNLHQIGNDICMYGCLAEEEFANGEGIVDAAGEIGFSYLYVKGQIEEQIVFPGEVFFSTVSILDKGEVCLALTFQYPLLVPVGNRDSVWLQSRFEGLAWLGSEEQFGGDWVYVTDTGDVYHPFRDCTYLNLSVQKIPASDFEILLAATEEKLQACTLCKDDKSGVIYLTVEQGRYHLDENCGSLKRTISIQSLNEAQKNLKLCTRCGERNRKNE